MYDINIFLTYSILGFFYECIINFIQDGRFSSGFMYGPWTPIYGIGVLIILYIHKKLKKYIKKIPNQITIILSIVFTIDLVLSIIRISSLK